MDKLDDFDRAILRRLQKNNRETSEVTAAAIGLSPTACQRRIRKLRDLGAIAADIAVIAPEAVGGWLTVIVKITLKRGGADIMDRFARAMRVLDEVQQCYYTTGESDFLLIMAVRDMAHYDRLARRHLSDTQVVHRFHTIVAMDRVKVGLTVPI